MAENGKDPNKEGEYNGKIHTSNKKKGKEGGVRIHSDSYWDEINEGLHNINSKISLPSSGIGHATAGNNQQLGKEEMKEELAARTTASPTTANSGGLGPSMEKVSAPKQGVDDVLEKPEDVAAEIKVDSSSEGDATPSSDGVTPAVGGGGGDEAAAKAERELAANAKKQGNVKAPDGSPPEEKKENEAANSSIVLKIMGDYKKNIEDVKEKEISGDQSPNGVAQTEEALSQTSEKDTSKETEEPTTSGTSAGMGGGEQTTEDSAAAGTSGGMGGGEQTTENSAAAGTGGGMGGEEQTTEDSAAASTNGGMEDDTVVTQQTDEGSSGGGLEEEKENEFAVQLSDEEKAKVEQNKKNREAAGAEGLNVGRCVGYGALIEGKGEEKTITPFGEDAESATKALSKFRDDHTQEAKSKGKNYYNFYAAAYNEGMEEGIKLKREADGAARDQKLSDEQKTPEYQAGAMLGIACGAASAKGEAEIDTFYEIPKENADPEKVIVKGPLGPVRNAAMSQKQTPDGKLSGEALSRGFMQNYNMAQQEHSKKKRKGPEKDADYQAGYERGYKLGGQRAEGNEGDEDLVAEKMVYNTLPADAPKPDLQKKNGFYAGYNKGQVDVENSKAEAKKKAIEDRNKNPEFMSGIATGNMQGFLKALLDPSGTDLLTALSNPQVMKEGGIPEFFPIPDAIRTNVKAVLGVGGGPAVKQLIAKPLFQEGLLMGYNAGYGRGEQNRMTFKREQFKFHPDYQESLKIVYKEKNMGQLKAQLTVDYRTLQKQESLSDKEQEQLNTYSQTLEALNGEINKQSDFYQRGVIDCYNAGLPEEEQRVKEEQITKAQSHPDYIKGAERGVTVGENVFNAKEKIKNLRREGIDITNHNGILNDKIKKSKKDAQKNGKKYFDGYAQGYSETLRAKENADQVSDMGNQLSKKALGKEARDVNTTNANFYNQHKEEAIQAFEDGAVQGYNLFFEGKKINIETGKASDGKGLEKTYEQHLIDKEKKYKSNEKLKDHVVDLITIFKAGYKYDIATTNSGIQYGAPKGQKDAEDFNAGFDKATIDAKEGTNEHENSIDSDAYRAGYYASKKRAQYNAFRGSMIDAQKKLDKKRKNDSTIATPTTDNRDHTEHAATENSIADTSALSSLKNNTNNEQEKKEITPVELAKQDGALYVVNAAEHESQAKDDAKNKKWLTKIVYLKEGLSLKGTDLADATVSIEVLDEEGNAVTKTISNNPGDVQIARDFYGNRATYIEQLAEAYKTKIAASSDTLKNEKTVAELVELFYGALKKNYEEKLEKIKQAYITGYNALFDSIKSTAQPELFNKWNDDMAYIEGIKSQAPDHPEVQKLEFPTPPTAGLEVVKSSNEYKAKHFEGTQMGQRIKSGLVDLEEDPSAIAEMQGGGYERGYKEGKSIGARTGEVASDEMEKKPPTEQDIKKNLADERKEANVAVDPNFERGYVDGFFVDYWKTRDYHYGRRLGYIRAKNGDVDGSIEAEDGIIIKEREDFFEGFNKGRENSRLGRKEDATGKEGEEVDTHAAKLKKAVLKVAWRNAAINAAEELNILPRLGLVFNPGNRLYHQFAKIKSMKALAGSNASEKSTDASEETTVSEGYQHAPKYPVDTIEDIIKLPVVASLYSDANGGQGTSWTDLKEIDQRIYAEFFKKSYEEYYQATYQEALVDMMNLSMIVAMDPNGTAGAGGDGISDNGSAVEELMKKLEALFANGSHQNFIIDELDLIDRFYDLERRIETRHGPIRDKLEDVEVYQMAMEYYQDADSTLAAAEIQQLETDIQALKDKLNGSTPAEKKAINKEKLALQRSLKKKKAAQRKQSGEQDNLQHDWEQAEEAVKEEIDEIRIYMKENLGFDTPLESNDDILEYIKVNLETSEQEKKGERVYQDPNIFNNLVLNGSFDYQESAEFDAYVQGDGSLRMDADAEKIKVEGPNVSIEREGFRFTSKGLEHDQGNNSFTLFGGNLVTPKIEGGRHAGVKLDYNYHTFQLTKGLTIKSQIEDQIDKLQGG